MSPTAALLLLTLTQTSPTQTPQDPTLKLANDIQALGLTQGHAYKLLESLCTTAPHRLSGSEGYKRAEQWGFKTLTDLGFQNVRYQKVMVPHWERGVKEELAIVQENGKQESITGVALGGSIGTPAEGIEAEVIEVKSLEEAEVLGDRAKGKIVFYNRPMDPTLTNTFGAYGGAVNQRSGGAVSAAKVGAVAVLVRSMTTRLDDVAHTGGMGYDDKVTRIPAAAISTVAAEKLSGLIAKGPTRVRIKMDCKWFPDAEANNVIGELVGTELPKEVIVMGGHLDGWDQGQGAHDDGSGVVQSIEALRLIKELGWEPRRTIRVVLFANEENGLRGGRGYADWAKTSGEKQVAAIESDSGGFAPRGFSTSLEEKDAAHLKAWLPALSVFEAERFSYGGGGGADIGPLRDQGTVLFGLSPESQRYFDYHHAASDTLDKVNPRELQLGANAMALLAWLLGHI